MGLIGPKVTPYELEESARETREGRGEGKGLAGVKADAQTADPKAFKRNRVLAKRIGEATAKLKETDKGVPRFVLGWRLYPNKENPYWTSEALSHACGCGCGCYGRPPAPIKKAGRGSAKKVSRRPAKKVGGRRK